MSVGPTTIRAGATSVPVTVFVVDATAGTPETAVAYNTAGVDLWYRRDNAAEIGITEATQTITGAFSSGGFVHISDGICRLDVPNEAFVPGVKGVQIGGTFTDMIVYGPYVELNHGGYPNNMVYFQGDGATTGTVLDVNGTIGYPVNSEANAHTIATALGYNTISVEDDFAVEATYTGFTFVARDQVATIDLGASTRALASCVYVGFQTVSATAAPTGTGQLFVDCNLTNALTMPSPFSVTGGQSVGNTVTVGGGATTGKVTYTNHHFDGATVAGVDTSDTLILVNCTGDLTVTGGAGGTIEVEGGSVTITNTAGATLTDRRLSAVVNADTIAELTGDPGATPTLHQAVMLTYMALRNKVDITATAKEIHNNAGTVILTKTLSDDATTYSETKVA